MIKGGWGGMVHLLADALGMELDELREEHERLPAPETFETADGQDREGHLRGASASRCRASSAAGPRSWPPT